MYILGINVHHPDVSAVLLKDGELIAAVEEERFKRIKHWTGFPVESINNCLEIAGISMEQINHVAISRDPKANMLKKIIFGLINKPKLNLIKNRLNNMTTVINIIGTFKREYKNVHLDCIKFHHVEHHPAHLASAFFVSPFDAAAILAVDGFGDFVSTSLAIGRNNKLKLLEKIYFPHSLGMLYLAITQYLGFNEYGDEFKVMGLAPYGTPKYVNELRKLVILEKNGKIKLNLEYFKHFRESSIFADEKGRPKLENIYTNKLLDKLGSARYKNEELVKKHEDMAASLQAIYEECFFHILNHLYSLTNVERLCLAGGCAMNSVANGKIFNNSPFKEVFIQPASGDNGTSLGAAYFIWNQVLGKERKFVMQHSYWGPEYSRKTLNDLCNKILKNNYNDLFLEEINDTDELCKKVAKMIAEGLIIGWFQGRMEWGARALGNRSILADSRRNDMREIINAKIKFREKFRPFAPSILEEKVGEYFEIDYPDPFMIKVYQVRKEKRVLLPAVTHVDGSGRVQTVGEKTNFLYYKLIKYFELETGIPVILNTSFNENEPIVNKPEEAIDCFLRTCMDVLVMGNFVLSRKR